MLNYTAWAKQIIDEVGMEGADKLLSALDKEMVKIAHPEDENAESE